MAPLNEYNFYKRISVRYIHTTNLFNDLLTYSKPVEYLYDCKTFQINNTLAIGRKRYYN